MRYETLFTLKSDDIEIEYEINVDYEHNEAYGGGWSEPRVPEHCDIIRVTGRAYLQGGRNPIMGQPFDFMPLLSASALQSLADACLNDHNGMIADAMEMRALERRDAAE